LKNNAEGVRKFQLRVASTLGFAGEERPNAESVSGRSLATLSALNFFLSRASQGCRKLQPGAEIRERLRRIFKLNQYAAATITRLSLYTVIS
jgi:hypothetical protein